MNKTLLIACGLAALCFFGVSFYFYYESQQEDVTTSLPNQSPGTVSALNADITTEKLEHKDSNPKDPNIAAIEDRIALMIRMQEALNKLNSNIWNPVTSNSAIIQEQSQIIVDGSKKMLELFPEGSHQEPSKAKPTLWSDWATFESLAQASAQYAQDLNTAVANQEDNSNTLPGGFTGNIPNNIPNIGVPNPQIPQPRGPGQFMQAPNPQAVPNLPGMHGLSNHRGINPGMNRGLGQNHFQGIQIGNDGRPIFPPEITLSRLTATCSQCHNKFLINDRPQASDKSVIKPTQ